MEICFHLQEILSSAEKFWQRHLLQKVFAFHGSMGAGKTTFIHALCTIKGVTDTVGSPTFSIINEYEYDCDGTRRKLFHIDLYRLRDEEEVFRAGVEDCLNSGYTSLVEWPEKAPGIFPEDTVEVWLQPLDGTQRHLKLLFP